MPDSGVQTQKASPKEGEIKIDNNKNNITTGLLINNINFFEVRITEASTDDHNEIVFRKVSISLCILPTLSQWRFVVNE